MKRVVGIGFAVAVTAFVAFAVSPVGQAVIFACGRGKWSCMD